MFDVSIVIICMGKPKYLPDCLSSIRQYTTIRYETLVVAYLMAPEELKRLKSEYPWVTFIESNEIRGFSANNNLALRQAKGKYCFVLNDDTYFRMSAIDLLFKRAEEHPEIALISPQIIRPDGQIQYSGMPPINWISWLLTLFKLRQANADPYGKWIKKEGFFQTYNILGAAFLIQTNLFKEVGFFDERYFYGPEDRALSTKLNKMGYFCFVDSDVKIVHLGGGSGGVTTKTACATRPAHRKGCVIFLDNESSLIRFVLCCMIFVNSSFLSVVWLFKRLAGDKYAMISFWANVNVCRTIFSKKTTTEIFKKFYKK